MNFTVQCSSKNMQGPGLAAVGFTTTDPKVQINCSISNLSVAEAEAYVIGTQYTVAFTPIAK